MVKNKSFVNTQNILLLLFVMTLMAIIFGVSYRKKRHIENFQDGQTKLYIEYFYNKKCKKCADFEKQLDKLKDNDLIKQLISSEKIEIKEFNIDNKKDKTRFTNNLKELRKSLKSISELPALFIYESQKSIVLYDGKLDSDSIYKYIKQNHSKILQGKLVNTGKETKTDAKIEHCQSKYEKEFMKTYINRQNEMKKDVLNIVRKLNKDVGKLKSKFDENYKKCSE